MWMSITPVSASAHGIHTGERILPERRIYEIQRVCVSITTSTVPRSGCQQSRACAQIEMLKDMGANAIRTSHNMPAPELVELCDQMGMMLMVEPFR